MTQPFKESGDAVAYFASSLRDKGYRNHAFAIGTLSLNGKDHHRFSMAILREQANLSGEALDTQQVDEVFALAEAVDYLAFRNEQPVQLDMVDLTDAEQARTRQFEFLPLSICQTFEALVGETRDMVLESRSYLQGNKQATTLADELIALVDAFHSWLDEGLMPSSNERRDAFKQVRRGMVQLARAMGQSQEADRLMLQRYKLYRVQVFLV